MPILGAGAQPAGQTYAGDGLYPSSTAVQAGTLLDPVTGFQHSGRLINPLTGQYVFLSNGNSAGMPAAQQLVELAIAEVDFSAIDSVTANTPADVSSRVNTVLQPIVNQGAISIVSVTVLPLIQPNGQASGVRGSVRWRDLRAPANAPIQITNFGHP